MGVTNRTPPLPPCTLPYAYSYHPPPYLPEIWKIYPVLSVVMLEPAPNKDDPYNRPRVLDQDSVADIDEHDYLRMFMKESLWNRKEVDRGVRGVRKRIEFLV